MESLLFLQDDVNSRINKALTNFKKSPKDRITREYVESKLESLEKLWSQFMETHKELLKSCDPKIFKSSTYMLNDEYGETEEVYEDYKCKLKSLITQFNNSQLKVHSIDPSPSTSGSNLKLPKIEIPKFSGNYLEWTTFRDLFTSLVHNTAIDKSQKMQYLKGLLTGEAEQLVRQINISADNYERCWATLESRYNNKKYLSHCILKRMLSQRSAMTESASCLRDLMDTTSDCLGALKNLGIDVSSWDIIVIHIITLKLDPESRKQWELQVTSNTTSDSLPTFDQFKEFLTGRYRALEFLDSRSNINKIHKSQAFHVSNIVCKFCNESHKLVHCRKFIKADVIERRSFVEQNGLCFNCLGVNHSVKQCLSQTLCRICKRKHNSLLHTTDTNAVHLANNVPGLGSRDSSRERNSESSDANNIEAVASHFSSNKITNHNQVLLATAMVLAEAKNGSKHTIRALLDQGSQASFITEAAAQYLGLKKIPVKGIISGLEGNKNINSNFMVEIKLTSIHDPNIKLLVHAFVLKSITTFLPSKKITTVDWILELPLADPQYHTPNRIDILLGAEVYGQVIQEGIKREPYGSLLAQSTSFGWILSGVVNKSNQLSRNMVVMHSHVEDNNILKRFWEMEADPIKKQLLTDEEKRCEQFFAETTIRDKTGRYIVRLPMKSSSPGVEIKNSKQIAEKRLNFLVTKMNKNKQMKTEYAKVLKEYLILGHMEKVPVKDIKNCKGIYLPHFAVIREDKDTTKLRIVFDASCKYENGVSLNDLLLVGPTLQPELRHILMRWRLHPISLSADIVKMYRQIKVAEEDADFQRIVWKENHNEETIDYRLLRVTFGTASAPYLAVKVLQQVAEDEKEKYPNAAAKVKEDFYMDDLLTGVQSVDEGIQVYKEINGLLKEGGFTLQKWSTSNEELLQKIKDSEENIDKEEAHKEQINKEEGLKLKIDETMKLLGLTWNRMIDAFRYTVILPPTKEPVTKRMIISDISRLFDPIGWVSPIVVVAKVIIQKLWISGIEWDDEVPTKILEEWLTYRQDLAKLSELNIPRWICTKQNDELIELHGFSDASKVAYAATVYIRVINNSGEINVSLVTSKTKVAPIKQISIPRLELCGAVLLTRLLVEVAEVLQINREHIHAWTDSTVVLAWLNSHPSRWQTFVANRVSEILTTLDAQQWSHVNSKANPADCASRGIKSSELVQELSWFNGPDFLHDTKIQYSKPKDIETSLEEVQVHFNKIEDNFWERFSSLTRLLRVVAYCRRFIKKNQNNKCAKKSFLTVQELKEALEVCIIKCQNENFYEEIEKIKKEKQTVNLKGPLKFLYPFVDVNNILRAGGRLEKSELSECRKYPIVLPKKSALTQLIIADAHFKTLHGGIQLMLNYLRSKYWILGSKEAVKSHIRKCVTCTRYSATNSNQLMGQLPAARVNQNRPFKCTGVDYAGPINIRSSKGRGHHAYKGYISLFVCMATKAVHIEVVSDLTTQGFLAAYRRFVSRRGYCSDIWSDNGTNFVGAAKELNKLILAENSNFSEELAQSLASAGTKWHFIPPHSPNFGGLWEAGVKSVKFHLRRVIGECTLTYEELSTVLTQIEACLNSRPLSRIDNNFDGVEALTPGHFLVGEPLLAVPEYNESSNINSMRRWQHTQRMMQNFWRRWSQEYLTMFLHRYKWSQQTPEPQIGDLVLVKEDDMPPSKWLLGRVVTKHPGADGITRVVTLRTKNSVIKRPTSKLCLLPVMVNDS